MTPQEKLMPNRSVCDEPHQHLFVMMQLVEGPTVATLIRDKKLMRDMGINSKKIVKYTWQLLTTLKELHEQLIYHHDVSGKF